MSFTRGTHILYTVQPGDTLYSIAMRFGSGYQLIEQINAIYPPITDPGLIYPGQLLIVPVPGMNPMSTTQWMISQGDTLYSLAQRFSTPVEMIAGINDVQNPDLIYTGQTLWVPGAIYEVQQGDSLYPLSQRFGVPLSQIVRANEDRPGFSPDVLYPNYRLIIPLPASRNIVVTHPYPGSQIDSGDRLHGFARVFEANVLYQLRDSADQQVIDEKFVTASAGAPAFGEFSAQLTFDQKPTTKTGQLWVYERSAKDGSIINLVEVNVQF